MRKMAATTCSLVSHQAPIPTFKLYYADHQWGAIAIDFVYRDILLLFLNWASLKIGNAILALNWWTIEGGNIF